MMFDPNLPLLGGFAAIMVWAAIEDFRRLVIPNRLVIALCLLWPLHVAAAAGTSAATVLATVGGAAFVVAGGALLFARGMIGGGDVKLFAAATLWAGAAQMPQLLMLTTLLGGALALLFMTPLRPLLVAGRQNAPPGVPSPVLAAGQTPIPYGAAIAAAALIVAFLPYFR